MFREIIKAKFFSFIMTLEEFYNISKYKIQIYSIIYFLKYIYFYAGCFCLFFGSLIFVFRKFFMQSKVFPNLKQVKNHCYKTLQYNEVLYELFHFVYFTKNQTPELPK